MKTLITGASRGVGAALLDACRSAGHDVQGTATATEGLIPLDVTDPEGFGALKAAAGDRLDLLVCNAGVYLEKGQRIEDGYAADLWAKTFATNVTGVFLTVQHLLPALKAAEGAKIAIISSQMGSSERAGGNSLIYRSSKAAALNLGRNLAVALKDQGIAVGIYHPGWVRTDMGGSGADISPEQSAAGLLQRFEALSLSTSGCFEMWNGEPMPF
ncbi:SDR family NAD(P)-dependent oxidoreductase [Oceaniglobus roseus]|uniref:SDR family NAD(P)-dependent oxidoreductase n=1 Tax=Oceaniglobus roseus TaxID=1737570 RepID=UPI000C7F2DEE|nr:SDR family NAD(P)-dependent oxidoreductase [Kandeliimicrobium roseum]